MTADRPATEPRTEAGRVLLEILPDELPWDAPDGPMLLNVREAVLLIESGAAEAALGAAPRAEGLPSVEDLARGIHEWKGRGHKSRNPAVGQSPDDCDIDAETILRLCRPSDERVPESEEPR